MDAYSADLFDLKALIFEYREFIELTGNTWFIENMRVWVELECSVGL